MANQFCPRCGSDQIQNHDQTPPARPYRTCSSCGLAFHDTPAVVQARRVRLPIPVGLGVPPLIRYEPLRDLGPRKRRSR